MAGIIAGRAASGRYYGVAPDAQLIGVKVADDLGNTTEGGLIKACSAFMTIASSTTSG